jgi:chromate transporter
MPPPLPPAGPSPAVRPTLGETARVWLKIGVLGFGGPVAQIAMMHRIVVDEKRWVDESRFLSALNFCMLLPGPEAQQLAIYLGWLAQRTAGALIAGTLFVLPGALVMLALSLIYVAGREVPEIEAIFYGIKAAVLAIVIDAIIRIGRRALKGGPTLAIAAAAFVAIFFLNAPFPVIILAAAVAGALFWPAAARPAHALLDPPGPRQRTFGFARIARVLLIGLPVWFAPTVVSAWIFGWSHTLTAIGLFFSKMAVVTFGGAYAVLAYVAQQAVETYGWLQPDEMLTGLGLAETTPGPLILVVQFVAFLAAHRSAEPFSPLTAAVLGSALATWVTFVPSFLWIFLGAPAIERLQASRRLSGALAMITAAVVGVVLNLAVWFAFHVLFARLHEQWFGPLRLLVPDLASIDVFALAIGGGAMVAMLGFRIGMLPTLAACATAGLLVQLSV